MDTSSDTFLTAAQAAARLQVCRKTLNRRVSAGQLTCYRIKGSRTLRFRLADVIALLVPDQRSAPDLTEVIRRSIA